MPKWPASTYNPPASMVNGTTPSCQGSQTDEAVILAQALTVLAEDHEIDYQIKRDKDIAQHRHPGGYMRPAEPAVEHGNDREGEEAQESQRDDCLLRGSGFRGRPHLHPPFEQGRILEREIKTDDDG